MHKTLSPKKKEILCEPCSFCKKEYRKNEMIALLSREKRGASAVKLGYACPACFETLKACMFSGGLFEIRGADNV